MKVVLSIMGVILALALFMGLGWVAQGNSFFMYKFFAPKQEQVRRETFEQSKAYRQDKNLGAAPPEAGLEWVWLIDR